MTHDAYELSRFFAEATEADKTEVLLAICARDPELLLDIVREVTLEPWRQECKELVYAGKKIDAIKLCRANTGWGLKESKDWVEAL